MNLHLKNPLAVFDLETTGISVVNDRIIEISILKVMPNGDKEVKTKRVNPTIPISAESSMIHGIYDEDIKNEPTFKQIAKEVARFLEGCDLCGFNVLKFDLPMLAEELIRAGVEFDTKNRKIVDAQKIFHMMEPRTLHAAYKFYCNKNLENAHSAEADTIATFEVLDAQVKKYEGVEIKDSKTGKTHIPVKNDVKSLHDLSASKMIDFAGRMIYNAEGVPVFNFGKHKNKPVLEVLKKEPGYYDWILKNDFALNTKQKLTEIKLSQFNKR